MKKIKIRSSYIIVLYLLYRSSFLIEPAFCIQDDLQYRNNDFKFGTTYPENWNVLETKSVVSFYPVTNNSSAPLTIVKFNILPKEKSSEIDLNEVLPKILESYKYDLVDKKFLEEKAIQTKIDNKMVFLAPFKFKIRRGQSFPIFNLLLFMLPGSQYNYVLSFGYQKNANKKDIYEGFKIIESFSETRYCEIHSYGIVKAATPLNIEAKRNSVPSQVRTFMGINILSNTKTIVVKNNLKFGVAHTFNGFSKNEHITLKLKHPPMKKPDGSIITVQTGVKSPTSIGTSYDLEHDYEKVTGKWTFEFWLSDKLLCSQEFNVINDKYQ